MVQELHIRMCRRFTRVVQELHKGVVQELHIESVTL